MYKINTMILSGVVVFSALSGFVAHASIFDDEVEAHEAATAVIHCAQEASHLLGNENEYLVNVTGKHENISKDVDFKRYTFATESSRGGMGAPPPVKGPTLYVEVTVTQRRAPAGAASGGNRSKVEWNCRLEN